MKVRFVGHASISVTCQNKTILCDPWFAGKVFNNSWALVTPPSPPPFSIIDHIWISHEHPDHFSFPTLKSIPDVDKARITVLYQQHASPRIVDALVKLGFTRIIELPLYKRYRLDPDVEIFCGSAGIMDSFIVIRDNKECILNLNDCVFNVDQLHYIKRRVGMSQEWSSDFSYGYFRRILQTVQSNFELHLLSEGLDIPRTGGQPRLILRHDIDISLKRALEVAEIERESGVRATYMVMVTSPLYSLEDKASREILRQLVSMGHEVTLHFDVDDAQRNGACEIGALELNIYAARRYLEQITCQPVRSISFHRPLPQFLHGPERIAGMVNAYWRELMGWYLSDSKGCWREGEPLPKLLRPEKHLLQLLIHPIWWGSEHMSPEERLQEFFETETRGQSRHTIEAFETSLAKAIPSVRCSGSRKLAIGGKA